jgi:hypothetical protein
MRFRITQTTVIEYEVDPTNYVMPLETTEPTPEEMLEIDLKQAREDDTWIACVDDPISREVKGEIINAE